MSQSQVRCSFYGRHCAVFFMLMLKSCAVISRLSAVCPLSFMSAIVFRIPNERFSSIHQRSLSITYSKATERPLTVRRNPKNALLVTDGTHGIAFFVPISDHCAAISCLFPVLFSVIIRRLYFGYRTRAFYAHRCSLPFGSPGDSRCG